MNLPEKMPICYAVMYVVTIVMFIISIKRKWTPAMEDILLKVKDQLLKDIKNYFKNEDKNIVMVCVPIIIRINVFKPLNLFIIPT